MPTIIASQDHNLDPAVFQKPRHSGRSRKLKLCPPALSEPPTEPHSYQGRKFKLSLQESQRNENTRFQNPIHCSSNGLPTNFSKTKRNPKSQRAFAAQTRSNYYKQICAGVGFERNLTLAFGSIPVVTTMPNHHLFALKERKKTDFQHYHRQQQ